MKKKYGEGLNGKQSFQDVPRGSFAAQGQKHVDLIEVNLVALAVVGSCRLAHINHKNLVRPVGHRLIMRDKASISMIIHFKTTNKHIHLFIITIAILKAPYHG
ncbi:hypothetical protein ACJX0J_013286 [Zea mays]